MGDKPASQSENIWHEIDSIVASHVGQRVYYNDQVHGKCLAFVTKAGYERDEGGILNDLIVFPPGGSPYPVLNVHLSSDRRVGTFDIAHPGDLTDSGTVEHPGGEVIVEVPDDSQPGAPAGNLAPQFDPRDADKDGTVTKAERKAYDKQGGK